MAHDREIAGIRCTEILAGLSDYLAGELPEATTAKIEAHVARCTWCDHFGDEFSAVVHQLRTHLSEPEAPSPEATDRLLAFLDLESE